MRTALALLALCLAACSDPSWDLDWRPPASSPIEAPAVYATWWSEVAACIGRSDEGFERIAWYKVGDEHVFQTPDFGLASGRWVPPHEIYIAFVHLQTAEVVKHEMIHDLLQGGQHDDTPLDDPLFECAAQ
jgi:hypothetical protein